MCRWPTAGPRRSIAHEHHVHEAIIEDLHHASSVLLRGTFVLLRLSYAVLICGMAATLAA